ncbi:MAG TPA: hypothetical protein VH520_11335 [Streptosporangiaceae bacterium]|jgi:hypothetical protein
MDTHPSPLPPDPVAADIGSPLPHRRVVITIGSPLPPDHDLVISPAEPSQATENPVIS